jgi:hypothetical protein
MLNARQSRVTEKAKWSCEGLSRLLAAALGGFSPDTYWRATAGGYGSTNAIRKSAK